VNFTWYNFFDLLERLEKVSEKKINLNLTLIAKPEAFRKGECLIER